MEDVCVDKRGLSDEVYGRSVKRACLKRSAQRMTEEGLLRMEKLPVKGESAAAPSKRTEVWLQVSI